MRSRLFSLLLILMAFCASASAQKAESKETFPVPNLSKKINEKKQILAERLLFQSINAFSLDKIDSAYHYAHESLKLNPNSAAAYYQWFKTEYFYGRLKNGLHAIRQAYLLDSTNITYIQEYGQTAKNAQDIGRSKKCYIQLERIQPSNPEAYRGQLDCAINESEFELGLRMIQRIKELQNYDDVIFRAHFIILSQIDTTKAVQMSEDYFHETGTLLPAITLADYYLNRNNDRFKYWLDKAEAIQYDNYFVLLFRAEYYMKKKDAVSAFRCLRQILNNDQIETVGKLNIYSRIANNQVFSENFYDTIDSMMTNENELKSSTVFHEIVGSWKLYYDKSPRPEKYLMDRLRELSENRELFAQLQANYAEGKVTEEHLSILNMYVRLIEYLIEKKQRKTASYYTEMAYRLCPYSARITYYKARLVAVEDQKLAIPYYEQILAFNSGDTLIIVSACMEIAGYYANAKQKSKAIAAYEKALSYNYKIPHLYNNYAYYLAENDMELDKAYQLIMQEIEAGTKSLYELDTYGYILYKLKRYTEAKIQFENIISSSTKVSAVIYSHYADVLTALGDNEAASVYYEKAKQIQ